MAFTSCVSRRPDVFQGVQGHGVKGFDVFFDVEASGVSEMENLGTHSELQRFRQLLTESEKIKDRTGIFKIAFSESGCVPALGQEFASDLARVPTLQHLRRFADGLPQEKLVRRCGQFIRAEGHHEPVPLVDGGLLQNEHVNLPVTDD